MDASKNVDVVVIGAGMHGLAMAKTYLQVNPHSNLIVVDKAKTVGGTWAKERLYPGLKTNNLFGSYEFGDMAMSPEKYGEQSGRHIPGTAVHSYFSEVASRFDIEPHIRYETTAESATLLENGCWEVELSHSVSRYTIFANKLVIATGLTSEPHLPNINGMDLFNGRLIHSRHLKAEATELGNCRNVVVLGGNKSAWDVCYSAARSGSLVHMIIRPSGGGPSYVWPKTFNVGPFTLSLASLSSTRIFTYFDPTPFGEQNILKRFLHNTIIGGKICQLFWRLLDSRIRQLNGYDTHSEIKKLEPWTTPFWMGNSLSIHNYDDDWFQLVREGRIQVHIAEPISLSEHAVQLAGGQSIEADAVVCCTGWKAEPTVKLCSSRSLLNVTHPNSLDALAQEKMESHIYGNIVYLRTLPRRTSNAPIMLAQPPSAPPTPYQLYRLIVPCEMAFIKKRNLAFIGAHASPHAVLVAQAQALWTTAFFQGKIANLQEERVDPLVIEYSAIYHSIYERLRRPKVTGGSGERYPDLVFDSIPYVDTLLQDIDLQPKRKDTWWSELFSRYRPMDYKGIVEEWIAKHI